MQQNAHAMAFGRAAADIVKKGKAAVLMQGQVPACSVIQFLNPQC